MCSSAAVIQTRERVIMSKYFLITLIFVFGMTACGISEHAPVVLTSSPTNPYDLAYTPDCSNAVTQTDLNLCAGETAQASQQKLDQLLKELQMKLDNNTWTGLMVVQQEWVNFRNDDCKWQILGDGSIAPMMEQLCISSHNNQRIQDLKLFLCPGNGLTNPCPESEKYDATPWKRL